MSKKWSVDKANLDKYDIIEDDKKKKKKWSVDDADLSKYDFGVDEDYINSFLKDSQSYLKSQGNRTNSYKSGISAYDDYINSDTRKDLDARASNIKAYLNANKGNLKSDAYQSTISYITDYNSANRSLADSYSKAKNYYSQWKTEDDYNFSINNNNNTLKYSKMSLADLKKEKEDYDKTKKAVNFSKYSKALAPSGNPQGEAISNLILDFMDKKNSNKADSSPQEKWNKEYKDKAVLYYDSKGNAVTYDDLIREKEHTQIAEEINGDTTKLSAYVNAQEAQKKILELNKKYNELETQKMAYQTNGFVPDAIIAEQQSVSDAINQQKAIIEDFNSFGYDFDEIQYYNQMKEDREAEVKKAEEAQKYAEEHEIKATFKSMLSTPMMIGEYVKNLVDTAQYGYANVYDDKYTNQSQVYQSTVSNIIEDAVTNTTNSKFAGWLASTAYSGVTSATQSAMIGAVGTVLSGGNVAVGTGAARSIMGTQAAASSFNTSVKNGSTSGEAIAFSLASGIGEAVFEKLPLDNIFKLAKGAGKTATKEGIATLIKGLAKQSAIEGLEEGGTELWNAMADAIINGDHSAYNIAVDKYMKQGYSETDAKKMASTDWVKEVVSSMVGGFIGGGVTGGAVGVPSFAINQGIQNAQYDALGKSTIQNENVQGLVADAQSLVTEGEKNALNKLANKVAGVENVDNLSERQTKKYTRNVGKLVDEVANTKVKSIEAAQSEAIKHELESNGVEDVSQATDIVVKKMSGQSLTKAETEIFESVDGNTIINSVKNLDVKSAVDKDNLKRTENALKKTGELVFSKNKSVQHHEMVEESGYTTTEGKTTVDATGVEVDSMIIDSLDGDDISLKVNMGENSEIVLAGELTLNDNYAVMLEGMKRIGKKFNLNTSSANKLLALYEAYNGDAFTFYKAMEAGISYGHYNIREYFDNNKFVADLPEAIREKLYEVGRENAQKTTDEKQALVELEGKAKAESKVTFAEGVKYNKLNKHQKAQVDFAQVIANTFGFDLEIFRSPKDASGRSLGENGSYSANRNLMRLDIDAGTIDGKSLLLFTQSHELTHYIQKWSPEKYKVFADFLMEKYAKSDVPVQKLIEQKIEESKISAAMDKSGKHHVLTESEAFDEIVANACEDFLADPNIQQTINMIAEIDQSIAQKIKNFIKNLVARLEKALHGLQGQSAEAQFVRELDMDAIEELKDLWTEALLDARENVLVARENNVVEEESHTIAGIDYDQLEGAKTENGDELFQYRAIQHDVPEYRALLEKYSDMSSKQIDSLFDTMNKAFEVIEDNIEILDYAWEENLNEDGTWDDTVDARAFNPVKANSDKLYKYSLDFSTMCRKRLLQQVIAEELSLALDRAVTKAESIAIRDELIKLQEEGRQIEIACALCYVESARMKSPVQIQKFLDNAGQKTREFFAAKAKGDVVVAEEKARKELAKKYAKEIKEGKITSPLETYTTRGGKTKFVALTKLPSNIAWEIRNAKRDAKANYTPTAEEQELIEVADKLPTATFTTAEGLEKLAKQYPVLFDVYTSFVRNATHSKGTEKDVWYRVGDVNKIGDDLIAAMNKENGLRSQSWSDFQVIHLLDYVAAIIELSTKKAKMQAYTKVPDYVNLMGLTGQMINLSLIPSREFSGKLDFDSVEGMAFKIALELRDKYPDVAGTISIGIANEQIQMLLDSADIDYVIPYHHSAMSKVVRKAMHIPSWVSYEAYQGEKKITSKKDALENAKKHGVKLLDASDANYHNAPNFSEWFDLEVARKTAKLENLKPTDAKAQKKYGVMYGAYKAMQEAADKYLELCAERGLVPKFCHANVDFTVEDNYWKLLIDRKMINQKTGEIIEQKPVQPIFNEGEVLDILNNEIARYEGVKEDFDYASRYVTERFLNGDMNEHITEIAKGIGETVNNVTKVAIVNHDEQFQDRDSTGRELSPEQVEFFKDSKVRDADGNLMVVYHGTPKGSTTIFDKSKTSKDNDMGQGIYFSTDLNNASEYMGKSRNKKLYSAYVNIRKPFVVSNDVTISIEEVRNLLKLCDDRIIASDVYRELVMNAKDGYVTTSQFANSNASIYMTEMLEKSKKYDGIIDETVATKFGLKDGTKHIIALYSNQIKNVDNLNPTESDDIRYQDRNYAPTFYSQMGRVIESVKQEKLGAASVVPMLKGKGIKNEEIKWSGIETFLEGKKSVTKQELLDFVAGSQLQIIEQVSGEDIDLRYDSSKQAYNLYDSDGKVIDTFTYNEFIGGYVADSDEEIYSNSVELEEALRNAYGMSSAPKWAEYKLNGGSNYRELLFKMPDSDYSNQAMKTHWGEDNTGVLAHARIQDFMVDGKKMLFIEEIQSDWHNEGTKEGYADLNKASALNKKYNEIKQRIKTDKQYVLEELAKHMVGRVDNPENASKSFIDFAYQNDKLFRKYVEKYDVPIELVNKIDSLRKNREESMKINAEIYNLENGIPDAPFRNTYHEYVLKRLIRMATEEGYDSIGWTPADVQSKRYSDEFAEAYRIEYDQDIPKFLNKYGKKWGAKVGTSYVSDGTEVWSMDITDSMKDSVLYDGQTMFQDRYIRYGKLTQNRIDYLIKDSGAGSRVDYANKWIATISPSDFIDLTLRYETRVKGREVFDTKVGGDYGSVMGDRDYIHEIRHNRELPYLMVDMETGKVLGHNGRHRMRALEMAGASRTPIGIIFYKDGYVYKGDDNGVRLESIDLQRLTSQFDDKSYLQHNAYIHNIIPLNEDHRKEIEGTYRADKFEVEHFDVLAYQDRAYRPTFEDLGIERENVKLKADVENLKEMLKLQSTVTHGKVLAKAKYKDVAKKLLHDFGMKQVRDEDLLNGFVKRLDEYFSGIINSDELTWEFVIEGAYKVAKWVDYEMPTETKPKYEYAEEVLKDIHGKGVVLDDLQKAEVAYHYGSYNAFRRSLFGNINFVNKGISLDSQWQEWSSNYPHIFAAEISTNDMPIELAKIIGNMKETESVLNEEEQMQRVDWMAEQIYDAYWLMPTVKTLADKHQLQVNLLKGKHREQMDALRESHKAKELKTKEDYKKHYEEMLTRVKEHKDAQLEAYKEHVNEVKVNERERKNRTVMKNRIKGVVKELNSILSKGSKERNVKIPIQPAVMKALELAEYLFDDDLSNNFILTQANIEIREEEMADVEKYRYWNNIKEEHMKNMLSLMDKEGTESQVANLKDTISGVERKMGYLEKKLSSLITNEKKKLQQDGVGKAVKALAEAYSQLKNSEEDYVKEAYNEGVYTYIDGLANRLEGAKVKEMSESQMFDVYTAFKAVLTTVRDANKLFVNGKREDVQKMSSAIMMQISGNKKTKTVPYEKLDTLKSKMLQYSWNELKPYYAFQRLGSSTLMKLYEAARQGEDVLGRDYQEAITFAERVKQKYGYDSWDMNKRYDIKLKDGREFTITLQEIMSIYAYSKREQAYDHMMFGGFVFNDKKFFKANEGVVKGALKPKTYRATDAEAYKLTLEDLAEIGNIINKVKGLKGFVDEMQGYLSTDMAAKGNEISRVLYGVDWFNEKNYFPIKSSRDFLAIVNNPSENYSLRNSGMTKTTVPHAKNPLVLEDFMTVWAEHVGKMSTYHSLVIPIDNLNKVLGYKEASTSMKTVLDSVFGKSAKEYLDNFLKDLNGGVSSQGAKSPVASMFGKFKKTAVAASTSVVVQQPTAILRAMAEIDGKYFVGASDKLKHNEKWELIKKYAPVAVIKELGGFDIGSGRRLETILTMPSYEGKDKVKGFFTDSTYRNESLDNAFMWGASKADEIGWNIIWSAVEREVKATSNLKYGTEEFYKKCGERFTEVVHRTQVYDSTFTRSGFQRSKSDLVQMSMSFMGEPTTSFNMLYDAVLQSSRNKISKGKATRIIGATVASIIMASVMKSFIYALRDDDEDESYLEKYLESTTENLVSDLFIPNMLPFVKDITSILSGWNVERTDFAIFTDIYESVTQLSSDTVSGYRKVEDLIGSIASLFGVPAKNLLRTGREIYNVAKNIFDNNVPYAQGVADAVKRGLPFTKEKSKSDKLYEAKTEGQQQVIDRYEGENIDNSLKKGLRDNDKRILKGVDALLDSDYTKYGSIINQIASEGKFSKEVVSSAIQTEANYFGGKIEEGAEALRDGEDKAYKDVVKELRDRYRGIYTQDEIIKMIKSYEFKAEEESDEEKSIYKMKYVEDALASGNTQAATEMIEEIVATKVANGKTEEEARKSVRSSLTSYWKPLYEQALADDDSYEQNDIRDSLYDMSVYGSDEEIDETLHGWKQGYVLETYKPQYIEAYQNGDKAEMRRIENKVNSLGVYKNAYKTVRGWVD